MHRAPCSFRPQPYQFVNNGTSLLETVVVFTEEPLAVDAADPVPR